MKQNAIDGKPDFSHEYILLFIQSETTKLKLKLKHSSEKACYNCRCGPAPGSECPDRLGAGVSPPRPQPPPGPGSVCRVGRSGDTGHRIQYLDIVSTS